MPLCGLADRMRSAHQDCSSAIPSRSGAARPQCARERLAASIRPFSAMRAACTAPAVPLTVIAMQLSRGSSIRLADRRWSACKPR